MVEELLRSLGYDEEPNFLQVGSRELETAPAYGHVFRRAADTLGLRGVYVLKAEPSSQDPLVPVVYICEAKNEQEADEVHRLVWNQDVVPFLLVNSPTEIRLYSGFSHPRYTSQATQEVPRVLRRFNDVSQLVEEGFDAESINNGTIWKNWGQHVRPEERVDWRLLDNLRRLDKSLRGKGGLRLEVSHALIGKYVYLHYLRDRQILSEEKLNRWNLSKDQIFGRYATLEAVEEVDKRLDEWLNGSVFPLSFQGLGAPNIEHLRRVAATFQGDELKDDGSWQLHLDFKAFNFSYIPIETLSVIYEQFLHAPQDEDEQKSRTSRGREAGAYYTPIPLVNFMLAELKDRCPLERGVRVLDPSCGSGAFLVQCFRQLVEKELSISGRPPRPTELRELLKRSIFGVDRDPDACSVTEFSLLVTMLDYINPPDLENGTRFKLPTLRDENIFCANFFQDDSEKLALLRRKGFNWIVGNPPWKRLSSKNITKDDEPVWQWIQTSTKRGMPVASNQVAQAFAWEVRRYLAPGGEVALLLPAMALFKETAQEFRANFFQKNRVHSIANFANLAEVLFARRSRVPAAAFFYGLRSEAEQEDPAHDHIAVYSPLLANQEPTRPVEEGIREVTWSLVLNASEVRKVALADALGGSGLPWKFVVWGSHLDRKLLMRVEKKFQNFEALEKQGRLLLGAGLAWRPPPSNKQEKKEFEFVEELVGKNKLDTDKLENLRHIFTFPSSAILPLGTETYVRKRSGKKPLSVCRPPHVIVSGARNFAVYTNDFLVFADRQHGIWSHSNDDVLLKAIALYLNSNFAYYHQFLTSAEMGVKRPRATLEALRKMPLPLAELKPNELSKWAKLHDQLVAAEPPHAEDELGSLFSKPYTKRTEFNRLLEELNDLVYEALGMNSRERALVEDLVHVKLQLDDGHLGQEAVRPPRDPELVRYGKRLKADLDAFIGDLLPKRHEVAILYDGLSGMIQVDLMRADKASREIKVFKADNATAIELKETRHRLQRRLSQWVYFNRNLRIFEGTRIFIFKPMQRFHWTESQATLDATGIISQTLVGSKGVL